MIEVIGIAFCVALCFAVVAVIVITGLYGVVVWCDYIRPMIKEKGKRGIQDEEIKVDSGAE